MEYASEICDKIYNDQFIKHVGFSDHLCDDSCGPSCMQKLYSKKSLDRISRKITELLQGVDKYNRPIIVPHKTIGSVLSAVYENFRPETGDIYSRYNIPKTGGGSYTARMIDEVINIITTDVKVNLGIEKCNENLSIWTTVLGDFNGHGLRQHPPIKLRERRPQPMAFQMNY